MADAGLRIRKTNWKDLRMEVGRRDGLGGSLGGKWCARDGGAACGEWEGGMMW